MTGNNVDLPPKRDIISCTYMAFCKSLAAPKSSVDFNEPVEFFHPIHQGDHLRRVIRSKLNNLSSIFQIFMDQPTHILYIEDNPDSQRLITRLLTAPQYDLEIVSDGEKALKKLENKIPDLILVDIGLPEMDGKHFTKIVRQKDDLNHIPVVALTAHVLKKDKESILESGCNGYIQKPINVDSFQAEIEKYIH